MKKLVTFLLLICSTAAFAQWERCENKMDGGSVVCMISHGGRVLAGTKRGIYFSTNFGDSWLYPEGDDHGALSVTQVYKFVQLKDRIFAATNNGIYYSTDYGENWSMTNFSYNWITTITANADFIFAANIYGDIKRSSDGGENWELIGETLQESYVNHLSIYENNLYVGGEGGLMKSSDNGSTWTPLPLPDSVRKKVIFLKAVKGVLYAGFNSVESFENLLFVSTDKGLSWVQTDIELLQGSYSCFDIELIDNYYYAATSSGVMKSSRPDSLWTTVSKGFTRNQTLSLCVVDGGIMAGTYDGVYYSTNNGGDWARKSVGLRNVEATKIYTDGVHSFVGTAYSGIYYSSDNGDNWEVSNTKIENVFALKGFGNEVFASEDNRIFRWDADSKLWKEKNDGASSSYVFDFAIDEQEIYAGGPYGTVYSTNKGDKWEGTNLPFEISCLAIKDGKVILGSSEKSMLYWSHNKGLTWSEQMVDLQTQNAVQSILIKDGDIFVGTSQGLYVSSDDGSNWTRLLNGLLDDNVASLVSNGAHLFAGTEGGLYHSSDRGLSWKNVTRNLPFGNIYILSAGGDYIFTADIERGLYRAKIEDLFKTSAPEPIDNNTVTLNPSPAKDYVLLPTISPSINEASVYSLLGVKLFSAVPETRKVNVGSLPPGIYYLEYGGKRYKFIKE